MEFTLHYRGVLKSNRGTSDKQALRRHFHRQLSELWKQKPLKEFRNHIGENAATGDCDVRIPTGVFVFAPLICERLDLVAELRITMLRPEPPGSVITQSGDIDNRLKTLFDALRVPSANEIPPNDGPEIAETPFSCLLEDDNLITSVQVHTDRLLEPTTSASEVVLLVHVTTKATRLSWGNMGLA